MGDDVRKRILSRRAKLVAVAMTAAALGASTEACSSACLSIAYTPDGGDAGDGDAGDAQPQVCLSAPFDSGPDVQPADGASDAPSDAPQDG